MNFIQSLLTIPSLEADDARHRKLLNVILLGLAVLALLSLVLSAVIDISHMPIGGPGGENNRALLNLIYISALVILIGVIVIFLVNRFASGKIASSLFLLLLTLVALFSDSPIEVIGGRSLFFFTIPIMMASVLFQPIASFYIAILIDLLLTALAIREGLTPNVIGSLGFLAVATISWLSARSLEQALLELRTINHELDQRVADRTKELSQALSRERAEVGKNNAILQSIADGVIVFDDQDRAIVSNPSASRLLDVPLDRVVNVDLRTILNRAVALPEDRKNVQELLHHPELHPESLRFKVGDRTLSLKAASVQDEGRKIGKVAVVRDFTREAEIDEMKSSFVATVSHELRTPLNAILGYVEMVGEQVYGPVNEQQRSVIERIMTNTRRLLRLVSDLLDQAQIEAGTIRLQIAPFSPSQLIDSLRDTIDPSVQEKGLKLNVDIDKQMPKQIVGDCNRLNQILINLVNNAIKFTDTGDIQVNLRRVNSDHWRMEVTDTGMGISDEDIQYVFEPFRQIDHSSTRIHSGVGLGLTIVKNLTELMQGTIGVTSQLGKGSIFYTEFPIVFDKEKKS